MNKYIIGQYWLAGGYKKTSFKFRHILTKEGNKICVEDVLYHDKHYYRKAVEILQSTFSKWVDRQEAKPKHYFTIAELMDFAYENHVNKTITPPNYAKE